MYTTEHTSYLMLYDTVHDKPYFSGTVDEVMSKISDEFSNVNSKELYLLPSITKFSSTTGYMTDRNGAILFEYDVLYYKFDFFTGPDDEITERVLTNSASVSLSFIQKVYDLKATGLLVILDPSVFKSSKLSAFAYGILTFNNDYTVYSYQNKGLIETFGLNCIGFRMSMNILRKCEKIGNICPSVGFTRTNKLYKQLCKSSVCLNNTLKHKYKHYTYSFYEETLYSKTFYQDTKCSFALIVSNDHNTVYVSNDIIPNQKTLIITDYDLYHTVLLKIYVKQNAEQFFNAIDKAANEGIAYL